MRRILSFSTVTYLSLLVGLTTAACGDRSASSAPRDATLTPQISPPDSADERLERQRQARHPAYARLKEARATYQRLADEGGWPAVPGDEVVEAGDTSAAVPLLRERLARTGDLEETSGDSTYDEHVAAAVARFQARHGLVVDSLIGPSTRAALNVPVGQRIAQIDQSLDRWRTLPDTAGARYVVVNLPEFKLRAYEGDEEVLQMRVVVGKAYGGHATPTFSDSMQYVIFRPYWNIPPSIANEEILPAARDDKGFLASQDIEITSAYGPGAEVYPVTPENLALVEQGELRLRQKSGPQNDLGLVKFIFPNSEAIYLHDTPADHLFAKAERAFSHGCIRVERPADLAAWVLQDQPEWTRVAIDEALHEGEWQRVDLTEPIPVYLLYFTAFADEDGTVQFREDIYDANA